MTICFFNMALLAKWKWGFFFIEKDSLWQKVVSSIFRVSHFGWFPKRTQLHTRTGLCKGLGEGWEDFIQFVEWKMKEGDSIYFLGDN